MLFWLMYIKNIWLRTGVCWEKEKYDSSELGNCGYSLTLHQILTSDGILKVSFNVESKLHQWTFHTLMHYRSIHLPGTLNGSVPQA